MSEVYLSTSVRDGICPFFKAKCTEIETCAFRVDFCEISSDGAESYSGCAIVELYKEVAK